MKRDFRGITLVCKSETNSTFVYSTIYLCDKVGDPRCDYKLYINSVKIHVVNILGIYSELLISPNFFLLYYVVSA